MGQKIELFRVGVYIFFPVTIFYLFNSPDFFEKYVTLKQNTNYPPEEKMTKMPKTKEELEALKKRFLEARRNQNTSE